MTTPPPSSAHSQPTTNTPREPVVGYVHTPNFPDLLKQLRCSLCVSTYQAQRVLLFSSGNDRLSMLMRVYERPTGIAVSPKQLALCTRRQVWLFQPLFDVRTPSGEKQPFDRFYTPRASYVTGDIAAHEATYLEDQLILVNTRFSCLATLSSEASFTPIWKPPFITQVAPDDRCHLNGIATENSQIRYVTALAESDTPQGWRPKRRDGGIVMEYPSGKILARGLCMPHSPRLHQGKLWILNSGLGELQTVDRASGALTTVIRLPGFLRGLSFHNNLAFIGVCKIREKKEFGNLPIEDAVPELECAIYCIDIQSTTCVGFIKFTKGIEELFDIHVLADSQNVQLLGFEEDTVDGMYVLGTPKGAR